jgi:TonB family protein
MRVVASLCLLLFLLSPCASAGQDSAPRAAVPPAIEQAPAPPSPPSPPPPPPSPYVGKWWKNSSIVRDLALNEDQVRKLEGIFLHYQGRLAELRDELKAQESQLRSMLQGNKLDEAALAAQTEKAIVARGNLERENAAMTLGFRRLLSAGQWNKLQEMKEQLAQPPPPPSPPAPPPPPPPEDRLNSDETVYSLSRDTQIKPPRSIQSPLPAYTPEAKEAKVEGAVTLEVVIRKDGKVTDVKVLNGLGYGLDASAVETVRNRWRFEPATLRNQPVSVRATIEVTFRLY